jgi:hypothetical protein
MKNLKNLKKASFVALSALVLTLGLAAAPKASADSGDRERKVMIGNTEYDVRHDGNGPYIRVNGDKIYVDGHDSNSTVVVAGKRYDVSGHDKDHNDRKDHNNDDDD